MYTKGMITVAVTDLKSVDDLLEKIEHGEICLITKEGNPIAEVLPLRSQEKPGWKRKIKRVKLPEGVSLQKIIEEERESFNFPLREEIDEAWAIESNRRIDAFNRGELTERPIEEVFERINKMNM